MQENLHLILMKVKLIFKKSINYCTVPRQLSMIQFMQITEVLVREVTDAGEEPPTFILTYNGQKRNGYHSYHLISPDCTGTWDRLRSLAARLDNEFSELIGKTDKNIYGPGPGKSLRMLGTCARDEVRVKRVIFVQKPTGECREFRDKDGVSIGLMKLCSLIEGLHLSMNNGYVHAIAEQNRLGMVAPRRIITNEDNNDEPARMPDADNNASPHPSQGPVVIDCRRGQRRPREDGANEIDIDEWEFDQEKFDALCMAIMVHLGDRDDFWTRPDVVLPDFVMAGNHVIPTSHAAAFDVKLRGNFCSVTRRAHHRRDQMKMTIGARGVFITCRNDSCTNKTQRLPWVKELPAFAAFWEGSRKKVKINKKVELIQFVFNLIEEQHLRCDPRREVILKPVLNEEGLFVYSYEKISTFEKWVFRTLSSKSDDPVVREHWKTRIGQSNTTKQLVAEMKGDEHAFPSIEYLPSFWSFKNGTVNGRGVDANGYWKIETREHLQVFAMEDIPDECALRYFPDEVIPINQIDTWDVNPFGRYDEAAFNSIEGTNPWTCDSAEEELSTSYLEKLLADQGINDGLYLGQIMGFLLRIMDRNGPEGRDNLQKHLILLEKVAVGRDLF
jgi:hypothetical protein